MKLEDTIRDMLASGAAISTGDVAKVAGVTRQAAHYQLARLVANNEVRGVGAGRSSRYLLNSSFSRTYTLPQLEEDVVWKEFEAALDASGATSPGNVRSILAYAFTEMLNNAIDHSRGSKARVLGWFSPGEVTFEIQDDGVGVFRTIRERFDLKDNIDAIQHVSKGKQTTAPERHTGQGIFFTSQAVDLFRLDSEGTSWAVDNVRRDQAIGGSSWPGRGTRVRCTISLDSIRQLKDVFDQYTDAETLEFSKSRFVVRLSRPEGAFISRSEAKRLAAGLEDFQEVQVDFADVPEVGQGFIDELFRVWAGAHPGTRLVPTNMNPMIRAFMKRTLGGETYT